MQNNLDKYLKRPDDQRHESVYEYFWKQKRKSHDNVVLVCTGAKIPHPEKDENEFAKYCLTLFIAWTDASEIQPSPTFTDTWNREKVNLSALNRTITDNLAALFGDRTPMQNIGDLKDSDTNNETCDDCSSDGTFASQPKQNIDDLFDVYQEDNTEALKKQLLRLFYSISIQ